MKYLGITMKCKQIMSVITLLGIVFLHSCSQPKELKVIPDFVKAPMPGTNLTGAFMKIKNTTNANIDLTRATCKNFAKVEIHEMIHENDMMKMREISNLTVKSGSTLALKPGSYHLMLFDSNPPIKAGDTVTCTLGFSDGSSHTINLPVKEMPHHHQH